MKNLRVIFMGTPEFAVESLKILVENEVNIVAVITAPDKPQGRGKKLGSSPVKKFAEQNELPFLQPKNLKDKGFLTTLDALKADLQIVVAFRMLPEVVWNMPPLGTFNLHASLLPQYRGAAPINWAIMNGETETGVTTFFLKHEIDTGSVIYQEKEPILRKDTIGTLYERLMHKGAKLVLKTTQAIAKGDYPRIPQNETLEIKHAPKIFKPDCEINWKQPAENIRNFVRGLSPYPVAWTKLDGKTLKVFATEIAENESKKPVGKFDSDGTNYIRVKTTDGTLDILELQLEGKKRMKTIDFLRGYKFEND